MIAHIIERVQHALPRDHIIVTTSNEASDDPLACYVQHLGLKVFRGPMEDVFERFRLCLQSNPCDWFFRISADSPLLNTSLLKVMMTHVDESLDLITNVQKRTFPHGHSAELLKAQTFRDINPDRLTAEDREHVTKFYYSHADEFRILNLENTDSKYARLNFVVDTLDDLHRVEKMEAKAQYDFTPQVKVTAH